MARKRYAISPLRNPAEEKIVSSSIENFTAEDVTPLANTKFKRGKVAFSAILQYTFMAICAIVFVVCLYLIVDNLIDKYRGNLIYNEASSLFNPITLDNSAGEDKGDAPMPTPYERLEAIYGGTDNALSDSTYNMDLTSVKASLSALKQQNDDVIGWIYVENTRINYPLMQAQNGNGEYYLTHAYTGEYLAVGSIYLVPECDKSLNNNYNSLIYGHNVANGTMFHDVLMFDDPEVFNNNLIYIYTLEGAYIYKPFSIYQTTRDYNYIQTDFQSEAEFLEFASRVKANSHNPSDLTISTGDKIITFSTCTNGGVNGPGRWAMHSKLIAFVE